MISANINIITTEDLEKVKVPFNPEVDFILQEMRRLEKGTG